MDPYEWNETEAERINRLRNNYRQFGLSIFESFEEYVQDMEEDVN